MSVYLTRLSVKTTYYVPLRFQLFLHNVVSQPQVLLRNENTNLQDEAYGGSAAGSEEEELQNIVDAEDHRYNTTDESEDQEVRIQYLCIDNIYR